MTERIRDFSLFRDKRNNNRVNFYQFKHYPDGAKQEKVSGRKLQVSKEITMKEFQCDSYLQEKRFGINIFGIINPV